MAKSISAFEGSNEVRHLNKSSVNVASGSSETSIDATKAFARTVPFSAADIGFVTVDPSLMTTEKNGVTYNITKNLENRSTNLDGDPTFFAGTDRGSSNSAVDVIPVVNTSNNGLMSPSMLNILNNRCLYNDADRNCDANFFLSVAPRSMRWNQFIDRGVMRFKTYSGWNPWVTAKNVNNSACIGNYSDALYLCVMDNSNYNSSNNSVNNHITLNNTSASTIGTWSASRVYNAVWNDYAELFERGSKTEAGDIVMLDINSDKEQYILAERGHGPVVGVHSDTYAQLIGGEKVPDGDNTDHAVYNMPRFIPVGLAGRVNVKVTGEVRKGQRICLSEIPGVGRAVVNGFDDNYLVGIALENHTGDEIDRIKMFIKL